MANSQPAQRAISKLEPFAQDCLKCTEKIIIDLNLADAQTLQKWRDEVAAEVENAVATAQTEAVPEGDEEDWCAISMRHLVDQIP